jgi:hypothetical protein
MCGNNACQGCVGVLDATLYLKRVCLLATNSSIDAMINFSPWAIKFAEITRNNNNITNNLEHTHAVYDAWCAIRDQERLEPGSTVYTPTTIATVIVSLGGMLLQITNKLEELRQEAYVMAIGFTNAYSKMNSPLEYQLKRLIVAGIQHWMITD